jgi:hypothetical protein
VGLVCRPNLALHTGIAGEYGPRHGNLREGGVESVFEHVLSHRPVTADELFFPGLPVPDVRELAERYGLDDGREVHFWPESMRFRWLDRAAA